MSSEYIFKSSTDASAELINIGINNDSYTTDTVDYVNNSDTYSLENTYTLVYNAGVYRNSPGIIKRLVPGSNILIQDHGSYLKLSSTFEYNINIEDLSLVGIGDVKSYLPDNYTLAEILGDFNSNNYNNTTNTLVQKIVDIQDRLIVLADNKTSVTDFNIVKDNVYTLNTNSVTDEEFTTFKTLIGDTSGFSTSSTLINSLTSKASISSVSTLSTSVNSLTLNKADKSVVDELLLSIGNLNDVGFDYTRTLIDTLGDLSPYNSVNSLMSIIGDLTFIRDSDVYISLIDYIQSVSNSVDTESSDYRINVLGDLTNISDISIEYTLASFLGNPNFTYQTNNYLNGSQVIDFANNNKYTISNMLVKIGKLYDNIQDTSTVVDILGDFKSSYNSDININSVTNYTKKFISISQTLKDFYEYHNKIGVINCNNEVSLMDIIGDVTDYNNDFNIINDIKINKRDIKHICNSNLSDVVPSSRNDLMTIIGDVSHYSFTNEVLPTIRDGYYPLYCKNNNIDLMTAYNLCNNYIQSIKTKINTIFADIDTLSIEESNDLSNIYNNLQIGLIYNKSYDLDKVINDISSDIYVTFVSINNEYIFKNIDNITYSSTPLILLKNKIFTLNLNNISTPLTINYSTPLNNNITYSFDTHGEGININKFNYDDIILYNGYNYILDSSKYILKNSKKNYFFNKVKIYTDDNLTTEYTNTQIPGYNSNNTITSVSINLEYNYIANGTVLYYGTIIHDSIIYGKITVKDYVVTNGVTYELNDVVVNYNDFKNNFLTSSKRIININGNLFNDNTILYCSADNSIYTEINIVDKQTDNTIISNLNSSEINLLKSNYIELDNWSDNTDNLYFIPYINSIATEKYSGYNKTFTNSNGDVYTLNLDLHYKSKGHDIISDIIYLKNSITNGITTSTDNVISDTTSTSVYGLGDFTTLHNNSNRTLSNIIGDNITELLSDSNITLINYLLRIGNDREVISERSLVNIIGNLSNYPEDEDIITRLNLLGNYNMWNLPTNITLVNILGNMSNWDYTIHDNLNDLFNSMGKITNKIGSNNLTNIFGDLYLWNNTKHSTLYNLCNSIGKLNLGINNLSSITGNLSIWNNTTYDTLSNILVKTGILDLGNNNLNNIFGNLSNWDNITSHDTLYDIFKSIGKISSIIGDNKLSNIFGDLHLWNNNNHKTLMEICEIINGINLGTNNFNGIFGDLSTWDNITSDTLINMFNTMGKMSSIMGTNKLSNIFGDMSLWNNIEHDTISNILNKHSCVSFGVNKLSEIMGDVSEWRILDHDTISGLLQKVGLLNFEDNTLTKIMGNYNNWNYLTDKSIKEVMDIYQNVLLGNNTFDKIMGDLSLWNFEERHDTLFKLFNSIGKLSNNMGSNTLSDIMGNNNDWNNESYDNVNSIINKLGKINIDYTVNNVSNIFGNLSFWNNVTYDTLENIIKKIGILNLPTNVTLSDIVGNYSDNDQYYDTINNLLPKIGLSSTINDYLPSNKSSIISLIGNSSIEFETDTISSRLSYLGKSSELSINLPSNTNLINVLGNFFKNNAYSNINTVTKRFEYLIGDSSDSVEILYNYLPKVSNTITIDRPLIKLLGDFNNINYGYLNSTKTVTESIYNIETILGEINTETIITLKTDITTIDTNLNDLSVTVNDAITDISKLEENKLENAFMGAMCIEGHYPLYFSVEEALKVKDATSYIVFPSEIYGPFDVDTGESKWSILPDTFSNTKFYMPVSSNITQYIPTVNYNYMSSYNIEVNKSNTYPLPSTIENIYESINNTHNIIGVEMNTEYTNDSIITRLINLETTNTLIGTITDSLTSSSLTSLNLLLGVYDNKTYDISTRLNNLENYIGINNEELNKSSVFSTSLTSLDLLLGDMTDQTQSIHTRINSMEVKLGNLDDPISNIGLNSVDLILNNFDERIIKVEDNLISGVIWKSTFNTLSELDSLDESKLQDGWAYYIDDTNNTYVVVDGIDGDYLPNGWLLKSFIRFMNLKNIESHIQVETDRAISSETVLNDLMQNEITRATDTETSILNSLNESKDKITILETDLNDHKTQTNEYNDNLLTLTNEVGDTSTETNNIQYRLDYVEKKIGIKEYTDTTSGEIANFTNDDALKLPSNNSLSGILGGTDSLSMTDFKNNETEPLYTEASNIGLHDDLMTIMRKLGRLVMGAPNYNNNAKYYNYTLSQILGDLSNYDPLTLGTIVSRLLLNETNINNVVNDMSYLSSLPRANSLFYNTDIFIKINNDGAINKYGNLSNETDILIGYMSTKLYDTNVINNSLIVNNKEVNWLSNKSNSSINSQLFMPNINTSKYLSTGYTIIFYLNKIETNVPNLFSLNTVCIDRQGVQRITYLNVSMTDDYINVNVYESDITGNEGTLLTSDPTNPGWSLTNVNGELNYPDLNTISNNPNEYWFFTITVSGYLSNDNIANSNNNRSIENYGGIQVFYKPSSSNRLNSSKKWIPDFFTNTSNQTQGNLTKLMDSNSWFIFGSKSLKIKNTLNYPIENNINIDHYTNNLFESNESYTISNSDITNITLYDKVLDNYLINELSNLTPLQYQKRFI